MFACGSLKDRYYKSAPYFLVIFCMRHLYVLWNAGVKIVVKSMGKHSTVCSHVYQKQGQHNIYKCSMLAIFVDEYVFTYFNLSIYLLHKTLQCRHCIKFLFSILFSSFIFPSNYFLCSRFNSHWCLFPSFSFSGSWPFTFRWLNSYSKINNHMQRAQKREQIANPA